MPTSSIGDSEPEVTSPPPSIGMPWRGIACSVIRNATSFRSGPRALTSRSRSAPVNSVSSAHDPAEAARDRVPLRADVVAVQRVADLEPQRVARAEAAGHDAAREDRVPERRRVLGHARQLDALLAGVAGAVDHHLDAVELAHLPREGAAALEPEPLERPRALHGEQRVLVGDVADVGAAQLAFLRASGSRPRGSPR